MLYTSGDWLVKDGQQDAFIAAWRDLAEWTRAEGFGSTALLLQDRNNPRLFRSFGPWDSDDRVAAWRASDGWKQRVGAMRALLEQFTPLTMDSVVELK